jgi:hypothetical protein
MYFVIPALRISSRAGIDSSRGVSIYHKISQGLGHLIGRRTGINSMKIIEIRGETQSLYSAVNVRFDVRSGIGKPPIAFEDFKPTFRGNCQDSRMVSIRSPRGKKGQHLLNNFSRTLCFLMKSPNSFSLTPA